MFYGSDEDYLSVLVPFVSEGLAAGHPVAVAVPEPRLALLRAALGTTAEGATLIDMGDAGRNPGRIIADVLHRFADSHRGRHVRIVGEPIWPGRTATEYPACAQHEALINPAFAGRDVTIVCPYDVVRLAPDAVADARATHPVVWEADRRYRSDRYDPDHVVARYNLPLDSPPDTVTVAVGTAAELAGIRRFARDLARDAGVSEDRMVDVELIVTELVTNSLAHTEGPCWMRIWSDQEHLTCEVRDTGQLTDPLAGRRPAPRSQRGGRGLLLVNSLADLVRTHTTAAGTTIRAMLRLDRVPGGAE